VEAFLREVRPFGVLLFARHLLSPSQVRELCACVREALPASPPERILDQEGGTVNRLQALGARYPGAEDLQGEPRRAEALAFEMGEHLSDLGFSGDFAPVVDLGPALPGTGLAGRLFGEDPETVAACGGAFLDGLRRASVWGCLKHFPGLGGSRVDSHRELPRIPGTPAEREAHLLPYRRLQGMAAAVMVAHAAVEAFGEERPTSLNPLVYSALRDLGFEGIRITDDLSMGALAEWGTLEAKIEAALAAGADAAIAVAPEEEIRRAAERLRDRDPWREAAGRLVGLRGGRNP
jgi:beta-N-acetylhexosaminidase